MKGKDIRERCRRVEKPSVELPVGYELYDDEDFVYLLYGGGVVAEFYSVSVKPAEIVKAANQHHQTRQ